MAELSSSIREFALYPGRYLPPAPGTDRLEVAGVKLVFNPYPGAQMIDPQELLPAGVRAAVAATRSAARARDKSLLAWMIAPGYEALIPALEDAGLVNEDAPGMEAVESAMALVEAPRGEGGIGVSVKEVETYEEFLGYLQIGMDAFEISQAMRDEAIPKFPERWQEHCDPANPSRLWNAFLDETLVGTAGAGFGEVGGYLFGGAVTEAARGRGVYRALTLARWQAAEQRGTPVLTVMAGRMSRSLCERLGFGLVGEVRVFVDKLNA